MSRQNTSWLPSPLTLVASSPNFSKNVSMTLSLSKSSYLVSLILYPWIILNRFSLSFHESRFPIYWKYIFWNWIASTFIMKPYPSFCFCFTFYLALISISPEKHISLRFSTYETMMVFIIHFYMIYICISHLFCYCNNIYILNPSTLLTPFVEEIYFLSPI